jgi:uncharacterized protein YdaU (DUF1376 family)
MNYYSFHIGDYASHTRHLSLLEDLAYRRLIDAYYLSEKPFVGSPADIAKDIGMMSEIEEVYYVLSKFFESTESGWINKRCDEEIAKYHGKQEQAVKAGKASAQARFNKRSTSVQPTNNQEPITNNHSIEVAKAPKAKRLSLEELPKEWEDFCQTERKDLNPIEVFNQFKDYWIAQGGQKGAKLDWFATWRNWVRNQRSQNLVSKQGDDKSWMFSNQGIEAKAKELGVNDYGIQNHQQLKDKVLLVMAKKAMA